MSGTRPRLLQNLKLLPALETRLAEAFDVHRLHEEPDRAAFLAARGAEFEGLVTSAAVGANAALIGALPKLRVISSFGVGLDKLDLAAAAQRGIAVGYTPDVLNDCVADAAFGLMLDAARALSAADRYVRRGDRRGAGTPASAPFPLGRKVSGAKLGIVGLGRIGGTVARCALGNVSRGSVIDETALVRALAEKRIAGAGLDVFEHEPEVPAGLLALDNVVLLPHIASATVETRQAMADRVFDNLQSSFSEGRLVSPAPLPAP